MWRYHELNRVGDLFAKTHGYAYANLGVAAYASELFSVLLGFCCFFATIKFIRLGRFNHRLMFFVRTLQHAAKDLVSFASMFSIVFWSFIMLFYLLFTSELSTCATLLHTAQMLFEAILMKFDAQKLTEAAPFLGPLSFSLFIFVVVFVCMSMFLTIINESFGDVRDEAKASGGAHDQHIVSFMVEKCKRALGVGQSRESRRLDEYDEQMRSKYVSPVEHFPEKVDELLDALDRVRRCFFVGVDVITVFLSTCKVYLDQQPSNRHKD